MLLDGINKLLWGDIGSQINYFEARPLEHHGHQVFTDVMQITLHRADHVGTHPGGIGFRQQRF